MRAISLLLCLLLAPHFAAAQDGAAPRVGCASRVRVVTNAGNFVIELDPRPRAANGRSVSAVRRKAVSTAASSSTASWRGSSRRRAATPRICTQKPVTEAVFNESGNGLSNLRGTVGFARSNEPHSGTSQFYVNLADNIDLNPRPTRWGYAVFGKIVEGMEVVDDIGHRPTAGGGPFDRSVPVDPIVDRAHRAPRVAPRDGAVHLRPASGCGRCGDDSSLQSSSSTGLHAKRATLYILGDLFEAWIGDDDDDPRIAPIVDALEDAHEQRRAVRADARQSRFSAGRSASARRLAAACSATTSASTCSASPCC